MVASGRSWRELILGSMDGAAEFSTVGTRPVADRIGALMEVVGGDGFLITSATPTKRQIAEIADGLMPELQKRGLARTAYELPTVKQNLRAF